VGPALELEINMVFVQESADACSDGDVAECPKKDGDVMSRLVRPLVRRSPEHSSGPEHVSQTVVRVIPPETAEKSVQDVALDNQIRRDGVQRNGVNTTCAKQVVLDEKRAMLSTFERHMKVAKKSISRFANARC